MLPFVLRCSLVCRVRLLVALVHVLAPGTRHVVPQSVEYEVCHWCTYFMKSSTRYVLYIPTTGSCCCTAVSTQAGMHTCVTPRIAIVRIIPRAYFTQELAACRDYCLLCSNLCSLFDVFVALFPAESMAPTPPYSVALRCFCVSLSDIYVSVL